jgi:hypothetical protein
MNGVKYPANTYQGKDRNREVSMWITKEGTGIEKVLCRAPRPKRNRQQDEQKQECRKNSQRRGFCMDHRDQEITGAPRPRRNPC